MHCSSSYGVVDNCGDVVQQMLNSPVTPGGEAHTVFIVDRLDKAVGDDDAIAVISGGVTVVIGNVLLQTLTSGRSSYEGSICLVDDGIALAQISQVTGSQVYTVGERYCSVDDGLLFCGGCVPLTQVGTDLVKLINILLLHVLLGSLAVIASGLLEVFLCFQDLLLEFRITVSKVITHIGRGVIHPLGHLLGRLQTSCFHIAHGTGHLQCLLLLAVLDEHVTDGNLLFSTHGSVLSQLQVLDDILGQQSLGTQSGEVHTDGVQRITVRLIGRESSVISAGGLIHIHNVTEWDHVGHDILQLFLQRSGLCFSPSADSPQIIKHLALCDIVLHGFDGVLLTIALNRHSTVSNDLVVRYRLHILAIGSFDGGVGLTGADHEVFKLLIKQSLYGLFHLSQVDSLGGMRLHILEHLSDLLQELLQEGLDLLDDAGIGFLKEAQLLQGIGVNQHSATSISDDFLISSFSSESNAMRLGLADLILDHLLYRHTLFTIGFQ